MSVSEKDKQLTDLKLKESKEKYKKLVEASTEGVFMLLENKIVYSNKYALDLLGYSEEIETLDFFSLIDNNALTKKSFASQLELFNSDEKHTFNTEARLKKKSQQYVDVVLSISKITFNEKKGYVVAIKDIGKDKKMKLELNQNIEKFRSITNNVNVGIFRINIEKRGRFVEANKKALEMLAFTDEDDIYSASILNFFYDNNEKKEIFQSLKSKQEVQKKTIHIKRKDGSVFVAGLSLFLIFNKNGKVEFCDGLLRDITDQHQIEKEKENMLEELQTANLFLFQPVKTIMQKIPECNMNLDIYKAATIMSKYASDAILITTENEIPIGIITDTDLRERVVTQKNVLNRPAYEIMSSPLRMVSEETMLIEALMIMQEKEINHLCVKDSEQKIVNIINTRVLTQLRYQNPNVLVQRIKSSETINELKDCFKSISVLVKSFIECGAKVRSITKLISKFADEITLNIITNVLENHEKPPVGFAFISLGSEGRKEQTLLTDQDNAIIFEDVNNEKEVQKYFLELATDICDKLNEVGYLHCKGDVMAKNPLWCMSLSSWKKQFDFRINHSNQEDLIKMSTLFDFQFIYGNEKLSIQLQNYVNEIVQGKDVFFYHLAQNIIDMKPPISFFGNFVVESNEENKSSFDIKKVLMPIIGTIRLRSIKAGISERNTMKRLEQLFEKAKVNPNDYKDLKEIYNYLMMMRIKNQVRAISQNKKPDNFINPRLLSDIERTMLKKIFSQISVYQSKLSLDYKGTL